MITIAIDILFENLERLMNGDLPLTVVEKDEIKSLYKELAILRSFVKKSEDKRYAHSEVKDLVARIRDVACEAEVVINWLQVTPLGYRESRDGSITEITRHVFNRLSRAFVRRRRRKFDLSANLYGIKTTMKAIRAELVKLYDNKFYDTGVPQDGNFYDGGGSSSANTPAASEEVVVGFENQAREIIERLAGDQSRLEVLSIVGMPGHGKTTLARKVYNDPYIAYYFHVRVWTYVSQGYQKRAVLLGILHCLVEVTDEDENNWSDQDIQEKVYRFLKGKRYLIVMDDIWDFRAWDDLKKYFPNDNNGSRILFTTRQMDEALDPNHNRTHSMSFLNENESWNLIKRKVFGEERCSPELVEIGKQIAEKCGGLPLAIVVVAGILAKENTQDWWKQVAGSVSSFIASDSKQIMDTLALSYHHLPHFLKPCFLYFALFPQNYEIPVKKLILLWVAEGFIKKNGEKYLEDVAKDYLMDLIHKSLVLPAQISSNGEIKACRLHDLLHVCCSRKSEEENFLRQIGRYDQVATLFSSSSKRSSDGGIKFCGIHDLLRDSCLRKAEEGYFLKHISDHQFRFTSSSSTSMHISSCEFLSLCFKLLKVLDISSIKFSRFPNEIEGLVLLRYLALGNFSRNYMCILPAWISNLMYLETLLLCSSFSCVMLPQSIREMVSLRHLLLSGPRSLLIERPGIDGHYPFALDNLQTLSGVDPFSWSDVFVRTPNLRKLGFRGCMVTGGRLRFPDIHFLNNLQKLKLWNTDNGMSNFSTKLGRIMFPPHLKKLTLVKTYLRWDEMSTLGKLLPNLEVLKLLSEACCGKRWETSDEEFPQLKFLKLYNMHIKQWEVSSDHFPSLQRLVLIGCSLLEKIPSEIGDIPTLKMIEAHECNHSVANSAWEIKEEQENMGNNFLQIIVSHNENGRC